MNWIKSTEIYTPEDNTEFPFVIFGNSYTGQFGSVDGTTANPVTNIRPFTWGQFQSVDLKPYGVAANANFCMLGGILIITGAADLMISFRAPGSTQVPIWNWYQEQLLSFSPLGGERSVNYDLIPLVDGCLEFAAMGKRYPDDGMPLVTGQTPAVGWNMKLKGWGR